MQLGSVTVLTAAALVAAGLLSGPAGATTPAPSLSSIQSKAAAAITLRVNDLNGAVTKVNGDASLGSGAPTLVAYLQMDIPGLQALGQKIAGDSTAGTARADATTIFTNLRVLALVLPAAHLAGAGDQIVNSGVPKLSGLATQAATYENASNQATVGPLISDMRSQISAAASAAGGIAASVLSFTPAGWNANHSVLAPAAASVRSALGDIAKAKNDAKQIRSALKAGHGAAGAATSTPTTS
jgi:uncharacterized protein YukE